MLRQFIDGTDEAEYCFITVLAQPRFLDEEDRRSVDIYEALKLRIWNEVRDKNYINPLASLVRISCCQNSTGRHWSHNMMNSPKVENRRAIEALRAGVPNRDAVRAMGSSQPQMEKSFRSQLKRHWKILVPAGPIAECS